MPSPDVVQSRLDLLQQAFPNKDRMDLQDALRASNWVAMDAMAKIRGEIQQNNTAAAPAKKSAPKKKSKIFHQIKAGS